MVRSALLNMGILLSGFGEDFVLKSALSFQLFAFMARRFEFPKIKYLISTNKKTMMSRLYFNKHNLSFKIVHFKTKSYVNFRFEASEFFIF